MHAQPMKEKTEWSGTVAAVQPRIRLTRSFDQRSHAYPGYILRIAGTVGGERGDFRIAISSGAHHTHQLRIGDQVEGVGVWVADPRLEIAAI